MTMGCADDGKAPVSGGLTARLHSDRWIDASCVIVTKKTCARCAGAGRWEGFLTKLPPNALALVGLLAFGGAASAQQAAAPTGNPLDVIPDKMPFSTPYGAPISLARAQAAISAAMAEADKRGWAVNVAVVDSGANLVAFGRMDGAQLASIAVAEHKARASASFRRPTKVFEDGVQKSDNKYLLSLDGIIASRGGIPLIEDGKLIGAIGCSGATGSQDEAACMAGAATINK
jgi:glc operon protein GlcG